MKYLVYIINLFFFLIIFLFIWLPKGDSRCQNENHVKNLDFIGVVTKKYRDSKSHMYPTYEMLNQHRKIVIFIDKSRFYDFAEIGDSLIKEKGSLDIRLIRNELDTTFTIDYGCEK